MGFGLRGRSFAPTLAFVFGCVGALVGLVLTISGAVLNAATQSAGLVAMWVCGIILMAASIGVCLYLYFSCDQVLVPFLPYYREIYIFVVSNRNNSS